MRCVAESLASRKLADDTSCQRGNFYPGSGRLRPTASPVCGSLGCNCIVMFLVDRSTPPRRAKITMEGTIDRSGHSRRSLLYTRRLARTVSATRHTRTGRIEKGKGKL